MDSCYDVGDVLEMVEDDDPGLYSDDKSECEAAGIFSYLLEVSGDLLSDLSGEDALDDEEEADAMSTGEASSSARTTVPVTGKIFSYL